MKKTVNKVSLKHKGYRVVSFCGEQGWWVQKHIAGEWLTVSESFEFAYTARVHARELLGFKPSQPPKQVVVSHLLCPKASEQVYDLEPERGGCKPAKKSRKMK